MENLQRFRKQLELAQTLPFPVTLWEVQNISYGPLMKAIEERRLGAENNDPEATTWMKELAALREGLRILGA
jgi:F0F1-type ATP synthase membrane subunit b/b'